MEALFAENSEISDFLIQLSLALSLDISQINQLLKCQRKNQSFSTRNYKVKNNLIIFFLYLLKWQKCEKQNTRKNFFKSKIIMSKLFQFQTDIFFLM